VLRKGRQSPSTSGTCRVNVVIIRYRTYGRAWVAQCVRLLDYLTTHTILSPIRRWFVSGFVNYKKGALDSQSQLIKFTSCLHMVGGSLRVLRPLPPLKLIAMI
jgi:hypothetical protein